MSVGELIRQAYQIFGFIKNDTIEKMRNAARLSICQVSSVHVCVCTYVYVHMFMQGFIQWGGEERYPSGISDVIYAASSQLQAFWGPVSHQKQPQRA